MGDCSQYTPDEDALKEVLHENDVTLCVNGLFPFAVPFHLTTYDLRLLDYDVTRSL